MGLISKGLQIMSGPNDQDRADGKQPVFCPNCQSPALKSGNEIGCEKCDAVFEIRKKAAVVKEEGLMQRIVTLEKTLTEFMGKAKAEPPAGDPPGEPGADDADNPAEKTDNDDPFDF